VYMMKARVTGRSARMVDGLMFLAHTHAPRGRRCIDGCGMGMIFSNQRYWIFYWVGQKLYMAVGSGRTRPSMIEC
jgi:hypothetical protein